MSIREKVKEQEPVERRGTDTDPYAPGAAGAAGQAGSLRERARELLSAGDDVIDRVLSGNSDAFLRSNRQRGGE
jgi:hypothetical protein